MDGPSHLLPSCLLASICVVLVGACQMMQDPFTDEIAKLPPVTTPSVDAALANPRECYPDVRPYASVEVRPVSGTVTHGPLYFETPYEDDDGNDKNYAWTNNDYVQWSLGPFRFLVNAAFLSVSALVTPPWQMMVSDGLPSRSVAGAAHDAKPATSAMVGDLRTGTPSPP